MIISIVVAAAENNVIGRGGQLPWRIPSDLRLFRELTLGKPVLMGRKTYQSIGKPLPGRTNVVITRDPRFRPPGVLVACSLEAALDDARASAEALGVNEIMVIGGAEVYRQVLSRAGRIYLTRVHATVEGDATLPVLAPSEWGQIEERPVPRAPQDEFACTLVVLERKKRPEN
jgi:dihydrofolate reductase